jgi:lysophospholipase L1-like esterase
MSAPHIVAAALAVALSACATMQDAPAALEPGSRYVAMGSSFAAGPRLSSPKPDTPARCARDQANYASLLAQGLRLELVDVTCSGATTAHVLGPWNELPAQLDALTPDTRLVTITIGGNDVGFTGKLSNSACRPDMADGKPCPPFLLPDEASWTRLAANLREIARQVRVRAPKARLVFVDYVSFVPETGSCAAAPIAEANVNAVRQMASRFAAITAEVARVSGADLLPAGALSRTHTPCDPEPWSVGAASTDTGVPWHPNAAGMRAIADALAAKLRRK